MLDKMDREVIALTAAEEESFIALATSSASLDRSPKKNWVENSGELPPYIRKLARAISKDGHDLSSAIAIAISRVKRWAATGSGTVKAKSVKALAQWEALKARNAAKRVVKASHTEPERGEYLMFTVTSSFNTDNVRRAWEEVVTAKRQAWRALHGNDGTVDVNDYSEVAPYSWIKELWTDFVIVSVDRPNGATEYAKVPYTVDTDGAVEFGEPTLVEQKWRVVDDYELDDDERELLADVLSAV